MKPLETYAQVILHSGCALTGEYHKWETCPHRPLYMRIAKKHQHKLQSNKMTIGVWLNKKEFEAKLTHLFYPDGAFHNGNDASDVVNYLWDILNE